MKNRLKGRYSFTPNFTNAEAVADEARASSKAGNEFVDEVIKKIHGLKKTIRNDLGYLRIYIGVLKTSKSREEKQIERTLDTLLNYVRIGEGEKEFQGLLNYYKKISPEGYDFYKKEYDKLIDEK